MAPSDPAPTPPRPGADDAEAPAERTAKDDTLDATRFRDPIPYGIDSWYPVLRGGEAPVLFAEASEPRAAQRLARTWEELPEGGRVILQGSARKGPRPDLASLEADLQGQGTAERFVVCLSPSGIATLLPIADSAAMRGGSALLQHGTGQGLGLLAGIGMLTPFGVPRRHGRPELSIWTKGAARDEADDLPVLPVAGTVAVIAGSPDRNQKIIVRAQDRRGAARAILKIGFNPRSDDAIEREARAIEAMAELCPGRAPQLLAEGERAGRRWMAQEVLAGGSGGLRVTELHADLLVELIGAERADLPLAEVDAYGDALRQLQSLEPSFDPDWHGAYRDLAQALADASDDATFPVHAAHGDFVPWNLAARGGELRAFDWEYFEREAPALHDLVHFHVQTAVLADEKPGERVFDELQQLFAGPGGRVVRALGLAGDDVLRLVSLYILQMGVTSEVLERLRPAPFIESARLRRVRLTLCQRLAGLLKERRLPDWSQAPGRAAA